MKESGSILAAAGVPRLEIAAPSQAAPADAAAARVLRAFVAAHPSPCAEELPRSSTRLHPSASSSNCSASPDKRVHIPLRAEVFRRGMARRSFSRTRPFEFRTSPENVTLVRRHLRAKIKHSRADTRARK